MNRLFLLAFVVLLVTPAPASFALTQDQVAAMMARKSGAVMNADSVRNPREIEELEANLRWRVKNDKTDTGRSQAKNALSDLEPLLTKKKSLVASLEASGVWDKLEKAQQLDGLTAQIGELVKKQAALREEGKNLTESELLELGNLQVEQKKLSNGFKPISELELQRIDEIDRLNEQIKRERIKKNGAEGEKKSLDDLEQREALVQKSEQKLAEVREQKRLEGKAGRGELSAEEKQKLNDLREKNKSNMTVEDAKEDLALMQNDAAISRREMEEAVLDRKAGDEAESARENLERIAESTREKNKLKEGNKAASKERSEINAKLMLEKEAIAADLAAGKITEDEAASRRAAAAAEAKSNLSEVNEKLRFVDEDGNRLNLRGQREKVKELKAMAEVSERALNLPTAKDYEADLKKATENLKDVNGQLRDVRAERSELASLMRTNLSPEEKAKAESRWKETQKEIDLLTVDRKEAQATLDELKKPTSSWLVDGAKRTGAGVDDRAMEKLTAQLKESAKHLSEDYLLAKADERVAEMNVKEVIAYADLSKGAPGAAKRYVEVLRERVEAGLASAEDRANLTNLEGVLEREVSLAQTQGGQGAGGNSGEDSLRKIQGGAAPDLLAERTKLAQLEQVGRFRTEAQNLEYDKLKEMVKSDEEKLADARWKEDKLGVIGENTLGLAKGFAAGTYNALDRLVGVVAAPANKLAGSDIHGIEDLTNAGVKNGLKAWYGLNSVVADVSGDAETAKLNWERYQALNNENDKTLENVQGLEHAMKQYNSREKTGWEAGGEFVGHAWVDIALMGSAGSTLGKGAEVLAAKRGLDAAKAATSIARAQQIGGIGTLPVMSVAHGEWDRAAIEVVGGVGGGLIGKAGGEFTQKIIGSKMASNLVGKTVKEAVEVTGMTAGFVAPDLAYRAATGGDASITYDSIKEQLVAAAAMHYTGKAMHAGAPSVPKEKAVERAGEASAIKSAEPPVTRTSRVREGVVSENNVVAFPLPKNNEGPSTTKNIPKIKTVNSTTPSNVIELFPTSKNSTPFKVKEVPITEIEKSASAARKREIAFANQAEGVTKTAAKKTEGFLPETWNGIKELAADASAKMKTRWKTGYSVEYDPSLAPAEAPAKITSQKAVAAANTSMIEATAAPSFLGQKAKAALKSAKELPGRLVDMTKEGLSDPVAMLKEVMAPSSLGERAFSEGKIAKRLAGKTQSELGAIASSNVKGYEKFTQSQLKDLYTTPDGKVLVGYDDASGRFLPRTYSKTERALAAENWEAIEKAKPGAATTPVVEIALPTPKPVYDRFGQVRPVIPTKPAKSTNITDMFATRADRSQVANNAPSVNAAPVEKTTPHTPIPSIEQLGKPLSPSVPDNVVPLPKSKNNAAIGAPALRRVATEGKAARLAVPDELGLWTSRLAEDPATYGIKTSTPPAPKARGSAELAAAKTPSTVDDAAQAAVPKERVWNEENVERLSNGQFGSQDPKIRAVEEAQARVSAPMREVQQVEANLARMADEGGMMGGVPNAGALDGGVPVLAHGNDGVARGGLVQQAGTNKAAVARAKAAAKAKTAQVADAPRPPLVDAQGKEIKLFEDLQQFAENPVHNGGAGAAGKGKPPTSLSEPGSFDPPPSRVFSPVVDEPLPILKSKKDITSSELASLRDAAKTAEAAKGNVKVGSLPDGDASLSASNAKAKYDRILADKNISPLAREFAEEGRKDIAAFFEKQAATRKPPLNPGVTDPVLARPPTTPDIANITPREMALLEDVGKTDAAMRKSVSVKTHDLDLSDPYNASNARAKYDRLLMDETLSPDARRLLEDGRSDLVAFLERQEAVRVPAPGTTGPARTRPATTPAKPENGLFKSATNPPANRPVLAKTEGELAKPFEGDLWQYDNGPGLTPPSREAQLRGEIELLQKEANGFNDRALWEAMERERLSDNGLAGSAQYKEAGERMLSYEKQGIALEERISGLNKQLEPLSKPSPPVSPELPAARPPASGERKAVASLREGPATNPGKPAVADEPLRLAERGKPRPASEASAPRTAEEARLSEKINQLDKEADGAYDRALWEAGEKDRLREIGMTGSPEYKAASERMASFERQGNSLDNQARELQKVLDDGANASRPTLPASRQPLPGERPTNAPIESARNRQEALDLRKAAGGVDDGMQAPLDEPLKRGERGVDGVGRGKAKPSPKAGATARAKATAAKPKDLVQLDSERALKELSAKKRDGVALTPSEEEALSLAKKTEARTAEKWGSSEERAKRMLKAEPNQKPLAKDANPEEWKQAEKFDDEGRVVEEFDMQDGSTPEADGYAEKRQSEDLEEYYRSNTGIRIADEAAVKTPAKPTTGKVAVAFADEVAADGTQTLTTVRGNKVVLDKPRLRPGNHDGQVYEITGSDIQLGDDMMRVKNPSAPMKLNERVVDGKRMKTAVKNAEATASEPPVFRPTTEKAALSETPKDFSEFWTDYDGVKAAQGENAARLTMAQKYERTFTEGQGEALSVLGQRAEGADIAKVIEGAAERRNLAMAPTIERNSARAGSISQKTEWAPAKVVASREPMPTPVEDLEFLTKQAEARFKRTKYEGFKKTEKALEGPLAKAEAEAEAADLAKRAELAGRKLAEERGLSGDEATRFIKNPENKKLFEGEALRIQKEEMELDRLAHAGYSLSLSRGERVSATKLDDYIRRNKPEVEAEFQRIQTANRARDDVRATREHEANLDMARSLPEISATKYVRQPMKTEQFKGRVIGVGDVAEDVKLARRVSDGPSVEVYGVEPGVNAEIQGGGIGVDIYGEGAPAAKEKLSAVVRNKTLAAKLKGIDPKNMTPDQAAYIETIDASWKPSEADAERAFALGYRTAKESKVVPSKKTIAAVAKDREGAAKEIEKWNKILEKEGLVEDDALDLADEARRRVAGFEGEMNAGVRHGIDQSPLDAIFEKMDNGEGGAELLKSGASPDEIRIAMEGKVLRAAKELDINPDNMTPFEQRILLARLRQGAVGSERTAGGGRGLVGEVDPLGVYNAQVREYVTKTDEFLRANPGYEGAEEIRKATEPYRAMLREGVELADPVYSRPAVSARVTRDDPAVKKLVDAGKVGSERGAVRSLERQRSAGEVDDRILAMNTTPGSWNRSPRSILEEPSLLSNPGRVTAPSIDLQAGSRRYTSRGVDLYNPSAPEVRAFTEPVSVAGKTGGARLTAEEKTSRSLDRAYRAGQAGSPNAQRYNEIAAKRFVRDGDAWIQANPAHPELTEFSRIVDDHRELAAAPLSKRAVDARGPPARPTVPASKLTAEGKANRAAGKSDEWLQKATEYERQEAATGKVGAFPNNSRAAYDRSAEYWDIAAKRGVDRAPMNLPEDLDVIGAIEPPAKPTSKLTTKELSGNPNHPWEAEVPSWMQQAGDPFAEPIRDISLGARGPVLGHGNDGVARGSIAEMAARTLNIRKARPALARSSGNIERALSTGRASDIPTALDFGKTSSKRAVGAAEDLPLSATLEEAQGWLQRTVYARDMSIKAAGEIRLLGGNEAQLSEAASYVQRANKAVSEAERLANEGRFLPTSVKEKVDASRKAEEAAKSRALELKVKREALVNIQRALR